MKPITIAKFTALALLIVSAYTAIFHTVNPSAFLGWFSQSSTYVTFDEAVYSRRSHKVLGQWVQRDQSHYDIEKDIFHFYLQDTVENTVLIRYHDPKPINFESHRNIVVEGQFHENLFEADRILMKCPSLYNGRVSALDLVTTQAAEAEINESQHL